MLATVFSPERLRSARQTADRTQMEAAIAVASTDRTIRSWERGDTSPDADDLAVLAALYGVPVGEFFIHAGDVPTSADGGGEVALTASLTTPAPTDAGTRSTVGARAEGA